MSELDPYREWRELTLDLSRAHVRMDEMEALLSDFVEVCERAVRLSKEHPDFKLYAMEPMHYIIARAKLKGIGQ